MQKAGVPCKCTAPCDRILYAPSLSYAQLSKFNVRKLMLPTQDEVDKVFNDFMKARETSQRVVSESKEKDLATINRVLSIIEKYTPSINESYLSMTSTSYQYERYGVPAPYNMVEEMATFISSVLYWYHIKEFRIKRYNEFVQFVERTVSNLDELNKMLSSFFAINSNGGNIFGPWEYCTDSNANGTLCNLSQSEGELFGKMTNVRRILDLNKEEIISSANNVHRKYIEDIAYFFTNTSYDVNNNSDHISCLQHLSDFNLTLPIVFSNITQELEKYNETSSVKIQLAIAQRVFSTYNSVDITSKNIRACAWYTFDWADITKTPKTNQIIKLYTDVGKSIPKTRDLALKLWKNAETISNRLAQFKNITEVLALYLQKKITKAVLHREVCGVFTTGLLTDIEKEYAKLTTTASSLFNVINLLIHDFRKANKELFSYDPQVISDSFLHVSALSFYAWASVRNPKISTVLHSFLQFPNYDREQIFDDLSYLMIQIYLDYTQNATRTFSAFVEEFTPALREVRKNLQEYKDASNMDHTFFM